MRQSGTGQSPGEGFALFDTQIGRCGIAWGPKGIRGLQLPEAHDPATQRRIAGRIQGGGSGSSVPPPGVQHTIEAVVALLNGRAADLGGTRLDWDGVPAFDRKVYEAARAIPAATTLTYGSVAAGLGAPGDARAVGRALGRNRFPIVVPCHRVVAARGPGGFSATGGAALKQRLLAIEQSMPTARLRAP